LPTRLWRPHLHPYMSHSRCCSTIFGGIDPIPSSCSPNLVMASKICLHLDVWDLLVLSKEELVVSPFDYSEKKIWVALACGFSSQVERFST
jgi:hypothetical protein